MADDAERLVVLLEARIRDFEKNMQKASGTAGRTYGGMRRDSRSATASMEADMQRSTSRINQLLAGTSTKIGAFGKGLVGGLVAGGVIGLVSQLGDVAKGVAQIGDEAKRAGVNVRAFQEWKFVAEQNRIGIDAMVDGLKELNLRADEFVVTGKGSAAEAFQRLGYSAEDLKTKLADPSALLLEIIGRLGEMDKAAQIRIADELFGGSAGERFVELLGQGEQGIRDTIQRAHELGVVMDEQMIKKAAEVDKRFNEISASVGTALKSAIVSAADSLAEFIDGFNEFEQQRNSTLVNKVTGIDRDRLDLENQILDLRRKQDEETGTYAEYERKLLDGQISALEDQRKALTDEGARIEAILSGRFTGMARTADRVWTPPALPSSGGSSSSTSKADTFKADRDAFSEMIGYTREYQREQEIANQRLEEFGDIAQGAGAALANALSDGKLEADELLSILGKVAVQLLSMGGGFGGIGGVGGGFLSGLFGALFDEGGYTGPGPKKKPAGIVHAGEVVWSQEDVRGHGGPAVVDAMRRRRRVPGYSVGGIVGMLLKAAKNDLMPRSILSLMPGFDEGGIVGPAPSPSPGITNPPANGNQRIDLYVHAEEGEMFRAVVRAESQGVAVQVVQAASPGIVKSSVQSVKQTMRNNPGFRR